MHLLTTKLFYSMLVTMGSSARKKFENLLILLAATFLLNILVGVPLVLVIYLLGIKGSGSGDTVQVSNFQAASPDQVQVLPTFLEAIDQLGLKPFNFSQPSIFGNQFLTSGDDNELLDEDGNEIEILDEIDLDPGLAPNCSTCYHTHVAQYFEEGVECPDWLNTELCCYCGKGKPASIQSTWNQTSDDSRFMIYDDTILEEIPESMINPRCRTCKVINQLSWIGDGDCDSALNNFECCFDGGDCLAR